MFCYGLASLSLPCNWYNCLILYKYHINFCNSLIFCMIFAYQKIGERNLRNKRLLSSLECVLQMWLIHTNKRNRSGRLHIQSGWWLNRTRKGRVQPGLCLSFLENRKIGDVIDWVDQIVLYKSGNFRKKTTGLHSWQNLRKSEEWRPWWILNLKEMQPPAIPSLNWRKIMECNDIKRV